MLTRRLTFKDRNTTVLGQEASFEKVAPFYFITVQDGFGRNALILNLQDFNLKSVYNINDCNPKEMLKVSAVSDFL